MDSPKTYTIHLERGPLDGLRLILPLDSPIPSEVSIRQVHHAPFWDWIYRLKPFAPVLTEANLAAPEIVFRFAGRSKWAERFRSQEKEIQRLRREIEKLRG